VRNIDPKLFSSLMQLPDKMRTDLLEFIGATPVSPAELSSLIERYQKRVFDLRQETGLNRA